MEIVALKFIEPTDLAAHGITGELPILLEFEDWQVPAGGDVMMFDDVLKADGKPAAFVVRGRAFSVHKGGAFDCTVMVDLLGRGT